MCKHSSIPVSTLPRQLLADQGPPLQEEAARLVQEIHMHHEELITHPRPLVFLSDFHSVKHLEVRPVEMMGTMDQEEEEMDKMVIAHQMTSPHLASDLVVLAFRLMMESILEMDYCLLPA